MEQHETDNFGPGAELPQPQEAGGSISLPEHSTPAPETRGKAVPKNQPAQQPSANNSQAAPMPIPGAMTPSPDPTSATAASILIADDTDLIEKEWVMRAKAIVMHTKNDPYTQNREMSKVKADYIKKRYNKDLKVSEG